MSPASLIRFSLFTVLLSWGAASLYAEREYGEPPTFKNLAGISLCAMPEACSENQEVVTFRRPDGVILKLPLKVFPTQEQERILSLLGMPKIPDDLKVPFERHRARLEKARALHQKGLMSDEDLKETEERLAKAWTLRLSKRPPDAPPMPQQINITEER